MPDPQDKWITICFKATRNNHFDVANVLIRNNADLNAVDKKGSSALHLGKNILLEVRKLPYSPKNTGMPVIEKIFIFFWKKKKKRDLKQEHALVLEQFKQPIRKIRNNYFF